MTKNAAIITAINALGALGLAFGLDVSGEQIAAIGTAVNAVLLLVTALLDPKIPFGRAEQP